MRRLLCLLLLIPCAGIAQQLANCENTPTVISCTPTGPSGTGTGDQPWYAFGKFNANFTALFSRLQPLLSGVITTPGNSNVTSWGTTALPISLLGAGNLPSGVLSNDGSAIVSATSLTAGTLAGSFTNLTYTANLIGPAGSIPSATVASPILPSVGVVCDSVCGNLTLSGVQTIDGQTGTAGTTVALLTAQTTTSQNGPWIEQTAAWTRPGYWPTGGTTQGIQFATTFVRLGAKYAGSLWRMTTAAPITIGTTSTAWAVTPIVLNSTTVAAGSALPLTNIAPINPGNSLCNSGTSAAAPSACPTTPTRYSTTSPVVVTASDNGGIIIQNDNSPWSLDLPQSGSPGITPGSFSVTIVNINGGLGTIVPTTSTVNNSASTSYVSPQSAMAIAADATSSPGNYNVVPLGNYQAPGGETINSLIAGDTSHFALQWFFQGTTLEWQAGIGGGTHPQYYIYDDYGTQYVLRANGNGTLDLMPAGGLVTTGAGIESKGTTFTLGTGTGACATSSTLTGGAVTGSFVCTGTAGASTQVINLPTAANGWWCDGGDVTSGVGWTQVAPIATTSCKLTGTIATTSDSVVFHAEAY